jgi:hypothetical protein
VGLIAALHQLADRCHSGGPQQFLQLGEMIVFAGRDRGHHQRALASATAGPLALLARLLAQSVCGVIRCQTLTMVAA